MDFWWVSVGAVVGAPARYLVDRAVRARVGERMPWGTVAVNVVGSWLLGLLVGGDIGGTAMLLAGTGFCGTFTTYSAFAYETVALAEDERPRAALGVVAVSLVLGLAAAALGLGLGRLLA